MKNKIIIGFLVITSCTMYKKKVQFDSLSGMWKLDRFQVWNIETHRWEDDETRVGYGGYILYDDKGYMALHLTSNKYNAMAMLVTKKIDSLSVEELRQLAQFNSSMYFYFARYKLTNNKKTVEHHKFVATIPTEVGTIAKRDVEFKGDTLVLTPHEKLNNRQLRVRWLKCNENR